MKTSFFIGIDVSKKTLDFAVRDQKQHIFHIKVDNSSLGLELFKEKCMANNVAIEQSLICWGNPVVSIQESTVKIF